MSRAAPGLPAASSPPSGVAAPPEDQTRTLNLPGVAASLPQQPHVSVSGSLAVSVPKVRRSGIRFHCASPGQLGQARGAAALRALIPGC